MRSSRTRNRIPWTRRWVTILLVGVAALSGCTVARPDPSPSESVDSASRAAGELAAGLQTKDLSAVEFAGSTGAQVNDVFQPLVRGMGPLAPAVTVGSVNEQGDSATAALSYGWTFPGLKPIWTYATQVQLVRDAGRWKTMWQPSVLAPELDGSNRLTSRRLDPDRGEILGEDGAPIVIQRPVVRVGVDKSQVSADQAKKSASRLARLVKIKPSGYEKLVAGAGAQAFVEAIVYRATDKDRPTNKAVFAIPGALPIQAQRMLAPNRDFARAMIGSVGDATKEIVDASGGSVVAGDPVGLSGLQKRYDRELRGTPGVQVQLVPLGKTGSPSASPTPTTTSTTPKPVALFEAKAAAGEPLTTTLNPDLQKLAESTLDATKPASALVAIRPSTGAVVAAANGPGAGEQALATTGQYPPGSTFKIATSLALLRSGLKPSSKVSCPKTVTVDGRKFKNYNDYPAGFNGTIDLRTALAQSCNTAFIGQAKQITHDDLAAAAASLGLGQDYNVGFPSYFGSVPAEPDATGDAAALIGQGKVQASPLAVAAMVASVRKGRTVVPHLIDGQTATSTAQPLTASETAALRSMMGDVVSQGSGRLLASLEPPNVIAKTGTAEYGSKAPYKTHVWMVAAQDDLAVAVFVADGDSGSKTAGPLLKDFLARAR